MAGGVTYAEIQAAAMVSVETSREIVMGGTGVLSPNDFIYALRYV